MRAGEGGSGGYGFRTDGIDIYIKESDNVAYDESRFLLNYVLCRARILEELANVKRSHLSSNQDLHAIHLDELQSDLAR